MRRRLANALDRRFQALHHRFDGVTELRGEVAALRAELAALAERLDADLLPVLRHLAGRDSENRRLLAAARGLLSLAP